MKSFSKEHRVDLLGIAPIERFNDAPPEHHPASIFPEARSVIVIGKRILRGSLRGIEEGTHFTAFNLGRIEQTFHSGAFIKRDRWLLPHKVMPKLAGR